MIEDNRNGEHHEQQKTTIAMICAVWAVALPVMTFAASGVGE